jgi:ribose 1,5-bisphosphokinase PhnN
MKLHLHEGSLVVAAGSRQILKNLEREKEATIVICIYCRNDKEEKTERI